MRQETRYQIQKTFLSSALISPSALNEIEIPIYSYKLLTNENKSQLSNKNNKLNRIFLRNVRLSLMTIK